MNGISTESGVSLRKVTQRQGVSLPDMALSPTGARFLDSVLPSTVFDADATIAASYPGTGSAWLNLANPADGSGKSAYNFTINGNPTFQGSAGSAASYFLMDGTGDNISLDANTDFINALHKTTGGSDFWVALAFRFMLNDATQHFVSTQTANVSIGISMRSASNENTSLVQADGTTAISFSSGADALVNDTDYLVIFSHSHSLNQSRRWLNTVTATEAAHTFQATTSDASGTLTIGSEPDGGSIVPNGTRIYHASMGNEYLDNAKAAAIFAHLEARHSRDYTP